MEIILGKTAGFCYGVERAVNEAKKELEIDKNICCLGEIVHNKSVIQQLEKMGIKFIENINEANGKVIIRAHGTTKAIYKELKERNIEIKDLTCPKVLKTHNIVEEYSDKNYFIVLIGIKNHPESIGTLSFGKEYTYLVQEKEDIPQLLNQINSSQLNNILILAQTTYNSKKFDDIAEILKKELIGKNVEIKKTICGATEIRQKETIELANKVEAMIIIGDKKSSNTNKLYDISKQYCSKVLFLQSDEELIIKELKNINKIGIMAGASTPKEDIEKVIKKIRRNL